MNTFRSRTCQEGIINCWFDPSLRCTLPTWHPTECYMLLLTMLKAGEAIIRCLTTIGLKFKLFHRLERHAQWKSTTATFLWGFFSYLYSRVWSFNFRAWLIDFTFRFCNAFLKTLPSDIDSPCLHLDLLCFCSKLYAWTQIYCRRLHRFPELQLQPFPSHSGCFYALVKLLLSDSKTEKKARYFPLCKHVV